jgi:fatty-acyl-CoA synthase
MSERRRRSDPPLAEVGFRSHINRVLALAAATGDGTLMVDDHGSLTGTEFVAEVHRLAWALTELGCRRGHLVAIAAGVTNRAVTLRYGAGLVGCATVLCPESDRIRPFVSLVQPDLMIVGSRNLREVLPETRVRVVAADDGLFDSGTLHPPTGFPDCSRPDDVGVLISSGGTTGRPKATVRTFSAHLSLVDGPVDRSRRQLICTPLAYVAQVLLDQTLVGGGQVILQGRFEPAGVLEAVERERITHLGLVEPLVDRLVASPQLPAADLSSLVFVSHIGATAPAPLRRRWLDALGPVLVNPYGSSECGIALAGVDYGGSDDRRLASAGRPHPGNQVHIERPDGTTARPNEPGRVLVATSGAASSYVGTATPSDAFRTGGWFASGDVGSIDSDGYLTIRGRGADERVVDGRTLMPIDLETVLYGHPAVRYAVAVPLDTDPQQPFGAAVTLTSQARLDAQDLTSWLARWHSDLMPVALAVLDEIPVTEQGKPDRPAIADMLRVSNTRRDTATQLVG